MDKNKCPKLFLKKKFQKTGIFTFLLIIENSPFPRIYELSLYLSTVHKIKSKINVGGIKMKGVSIP